jgi:hypothetical protein
MKILTAHGLIVVDASGGDRFLKKILLKNYPLIFRNPYISIALPSILLLPRFITYRLVINTIYFMDDLFYG